MKHRDTRAQPLLHVRGLGFHGEPVLGTTEESQRRSRDGQQYRHRDQQLDQRKTPDDAPAIRFGGERLTKPRHRTGSHQSLRVLTVCIRATSPGRPADVALTTT